MALLPEYLDTLPDSIVTLWRYAEDDILRDVARRLTAAGELTSSAAWQLYRMAETQALHADVVKLLAKYTGRSNAEVRKILQQAGAQTLASDDALYQAMGFSPADINTNPALLNLLNAGYRQTLGSWRNLTATTANTVAGEFEQRLDRAWLQLSSGAFDYNTAIKRTVHDLARTMKFVQYPTGHKDTLEVAVRRCVLTGANQTCGKLQLARAEEMGCEFVEVSAHAGARPTHAVWQGKVYHIGGAVVRDGVAYADFEEATGYGTGAGLCGWNCRHNFFPFWPGASVRNYDDAKLAELAAKTETYRGQQYTKYEISQMQRALERKVRGLEKRYVTEDAAGVDAGNTAARLAGARTELRQFIKDTGGKVDGARTAVPEMGYKAAREAAKVADKELAKYSSPHYNNDGTRSITDDWKPKGKVTIPRKYKPYAVIETQTAYKNGTIQIDRSIFDESAILCTQIHSGDHCKPWAHKFGKDGTEPFHAHDYTWDEDGIMIERKDRSLNDEEKAENKDILPGDKI